MSEQSARKYTALIVEDDFDSLDILLNILEQTGKFHCESAKSGQQAIDYWESNKPDITFLDIDIPSPDGIETLKIIRDKNPTAKVVMVTGNAKMKTVREAISQGAYRYVVKPYSPNKILDVIKLLDE